VDLLFVAVALQRYSYAYRSCQFILWP